MDSWWLWFLIGGASTFVVTMIVQGVRQELAAFRFNPGGLPLPTKIVRWVFGSVSFVIRSVSGLIAAPFVFGDEVWWIRRNRLLKRDWMRSEIEHRDYHSGPYG